MKIIYTAIFSLLISLTARAQSNVVKLHIPSLFLGNIALSYERALGEDKSVVLGLSVFPPRGIPFKSLVIADDIGSEDLEIIESFKLSGYSIAPEFRFYTSKKKPAPRGFYVAPYLKYLRLNSNSDYTRENPNRTPSPTPLRFKGHAEYSVIAGGFLIGYQWLIADRISIDWTFIGLGIGSYKLLVRESSDNVPADYYSENGAGDFSGDFSGANFEYTHNANSAQGKVNALLPNVRSGFAIGVAF